ncbi:MAG TPA: right-handed parallel beta-helix repeat-containing protein [Kiritimatiellia bacterium]|nr:right-handed parallel beta-helix repeat-containing protein [Kiritimatiellia bacterium]HMO99937.1 right-handed parallel beta-helix repeat-containing protein [Kiritimatiellia bacterium]
MKMNRFLLVVTFAGCMMATAHAQGPLVPAAPPAPGMKTLQQIEPRIPIETLPFVITNSGSYYLTGNLDAVSPTGIVIRADHVYIDLGGFTLQGGPGTLSGIRVQGFYDAIEIRNGSIREWGQHGIEANGATAVRVENVQVTENLGAGLLAGAGARISHVIAHANQLGGMSVGPGSVVGDSVARANTGAAGFGLEAGSTIRNSTAILNVGFGINASGPCVIEACSAVQNAGGIIAGAGSAVSDSVAFGNANDGFVLNETGIIRDSTAIGNSVGIRAFYANSIMRCTATGNTGNGIQIGNGSNVSESTIADNGAHGIRGNSGNILRANTAHGNTLTGIWVDDENQLADNVVSRNGDGGMYVNHRNAMDRNQVSENALFGINVAGNNNVLRNNNVMENQQFGIWATGDQNRIEHNHVNATRQTAPGTGDDIFVSGHRNRIDRNDMSGAHQHGLAVMGLQNWVVRNTVSFSTGPQYGIGPGNHDASILFFPGSGFTADAWANFAY